MASPQLEDGFMQLAHAIYEAFAGTYIPGKLMQVLWVIFRKTYGYRKKTAQIPLAEFVRYTNQQKPNICRSLKMLQACGYIVITGDNDNKFYSFQKDFEKWKPLSRVITKNIITGDNKPLSPVIKKKKEPKKKKETTNITKHTPYISPNGGCVRCLLNFLNERGGKSFPVENYGFCRKISKLSKEGYFLADFAAVIEYKYFDFIGRWTDKNGKYEKPETEKDMRQFYSPSTLFKPEKFAQYLGQAREYFEEKKAAEAKDRERKTVETVREERNSVHPEEEKYPGITAYENRKIEEYREKYGDRAFMAYYEAKPALIAEFKEQMGYV